MGVSGRFAVALLVAICFAASWHPVHGISYGGYKLVSIRETADGRGMVAALQFTRSIVENFGPDIRELQMMILAETDARLHVHITDSSQSRWEIPQTIIPRSAVKSSPSVLSATVADDDEQFTLWETAGSGSGVYSFGPSSQLEFSYVSHPFGFAVTRRPSGDVLFNSTPVVSSDGSVSFNGLVFKDQYMEISTQLPSPNSALFGLGESTRSRLQLERGKVYTLWNSDTGSNNPDVNLYGAWPFYMEVRGGGAAHGVLLLNSNGMDVFLEDERLTYRVIGGVLDFNFFAGTSPLSVMDQYTELVGRPAPMPYWSLGFHQSRWGYESVEELERVVSLYAEAQIPLEVIWSDIDYMDKFKDFTLDPVKYPEDKLRAFVDRLHFNDQKYVLIIDPGIAIASNYSTFQQGLDLDVYIKNHDGKPYLAQVWPGPLHFPDFLHPNATDFWESEITEFHKKIPFDGLWIDMNELSNFCTGTNCHVSPWQPCPLKDFTICCLSCEEDDSPTSSKWDNPPYTINCAGSKAKIIKGTIALSATHHGGVREYDAHNLYGIAEAILTNRVLANLTGKRPFILSRSTFVGSGAHTAHWTGDNMASWTDLAYSIVSVLNSGIAGIPMVGADICGFQSDTSEELCARWILVGAFYPFARDHSMMKTIPQELYVWDSVAASARRALGLRYRLLPYYYTLLYESHGTGAPIFRPLFFEFPEDPETLSISTQFLIGAAVLVSPVLKSGERSVSAYFPDGVWFDAFNFSAEPRLGQGFHVVPAPLGEIDVRFRAGSIIPMQRQAATTTAVRRTPFTLVVAFSPSVGTADRAYGRLFLDGGDGVEMTAAGRQGTLVEFSAVKYEAGGVVLASVTAGEFALEERCVVEKVQILGLGSIPVTVAIDGVAITSSVMVRSEGEHQFVEISQLQVPLGRDFKLSWESHGLQ